MTVKLKEPIVKIEEKPTSIEIKVGEETKTLSVQEVTDLIGREASATKKSQSASPLLDACKRYNVDPSVYAQHSQAAFQIVQQLQEAGVIDESGEIIQQSAAEVKIKDRKTIVLDPGGDKGVVNKDASDKQMAKALDPLMKQIKVLARNQDNMMRISLEKDLKKVYPEFTDDDLARVFAKTGVDETKNLFEHAKDRAKFLGIREGESRMKYAKEFGVNLENFDENKLNQQDGTGGAVGLVKGKKLILKKTRKSIGIGKSEESTVTAKQAMLSYFKSLRK